MIKILIAYLAFFILLTIYLKKLKYKKISKKTIIKGIVLGIISIAITAIISIIIGAQTNYGYNHEPKIYYFLKIFIYAALIEEFSKFISLKIYHPKDKDNYMIYSLIIGITFWISEILVYAFTENAEFQLIKRLLHPGHISYQVLMGLILYLSSTQTNKFKKIIGTVISILLPTFIHTLFNALRGYTFYTVSQTLISNYITIFEYYIIIVGLYTFKKKIGEKNG